MSNETKSNYQKLVNWGHGLSILFAALGVIIVTIIVCFLLFNTPEKTKTENKFEVKYNLQIDPIQLKKLKGQDAIEYFKLIEQNNKKIADEFNQKINDQYERTQKLIELKEEQNLYNTYGAGIIAIILAIGSFFGFKSINQMHKDTIETAEIEAKKAAEKETKEFLSLKLDEIQKNIRNQVILESGEQIKSISEDYSKLVERYSKLDERIKKMESPISSTDFKEESDNSQVLKRESHDLFDDNDLNID